MAKGVKTSWKIVVYVKNTQNINSKRMAKGVKTSLKKHLIDGKDAKAI